MCLTLDALIVFLNIIGPQMVSSEPGRFIIHAKDGDTHWVETDAVWCTMGPQLDRMARFDSVPG